MTSNRKPTNKNTVQDRFVPSPDSVKIMGWTSAMYKTILAGRIPRMRTGNFWNSVPNYTAPKFIQRRAA